MRDTELVEVARSVPLGCLAHVASHKLLSLTLFSALSPINPAYNYTPAIFSTAPRGEKGE
jgi:hypothetical protein